MPRIKYPMLGAIAVTALLFIYFSPYIIHANHLSFAPWGDGYKNYYTFAYYLNYDTGAHFSGMNYPYGENVIYTDNQPLLAWILKPVSKLLPQVLHYTHGIIVWLIMLSHVLCFLALYKLLRELELPQPFALVFGMLITMLSPQIARLNGHFSLSYTFFFPTVMLLVLKFLKTSYRLKYMLWLAAFITAFTFIHPYYFAISALFLLSIGAIVLLRQNSFGDRLSAFGKILVPVIIPFLFFKAYVIISDPVTDRPTSPWGFVESRSKLQDIFSHNNAFLYQFITKLFPATRVGFDSEGQAYIGLIGDIIVAVLIINLALALFSKKIPVISFTRPWQAILIGSVPVLLFAMAFPFSLNSYFENWVAYLPATIKQFRAAGRFSWVFYYAISITSALLIYTVFQKIKNLVLAFSFLAVAILVWFIDSNTTNNYNKLVLRVWTKPTHEAADIGNAIHLLEEKHRRVSDYQAIFPMPFFLNGSEKIYIESAAGFYTMQASLATGLPLVCGQMSRTSENVSFNVANLLAGPFIRKEVLSRYNQKPLLLIATGAPYSPSENYLLSKAQYLFDTDGMQYFELPISAFKDSLEETKLFYGSHQADFIHHGEYSTLDRVNNVLIKTWDNQPSANAIFGTGAVYCPKGTIWLYADTLPAARDLVQYEISAWFYADDRRPAFADLYVTETDSSGKEIQNFDCNPKFSTVTYGKWVRASRTFVLSNRTNKIYVAGTGDYGAYDELMIRPVNTSVITHLKDASHFMFNNFPIY
jgi:hypothetical protein